MVGGNNALVRAEWTLRDGMKVQIVKRQDAWTPSRPWFVYCNGQPIHSVGYRTRTLAENTVLCALGRNPNQ